MDISNINNIGHAWASWERDEANKGKGVRSKGWVTKEQMRKNAAQKTLGIMIAVAVLTALSAIFIKIFGKAVGALMMVVLVVGLPTCYIIREVYGYNVQLLPLWIVGFALMLKIFTIIFGRKWGLRVGIPMLAIVGAGVFVDKKMEAGLALPAIESLYSPWNSPGKNTGVGSLSLLQGIFPTQGLNPGLPHCWWILYQLSHYSVI